MSKEKSDTSIDKEILMGIMTGDNIALKQLYKYHYPHVAHMILNNQGSTEEAQDVFQEAVMVLYTKVSQGDFELTSKLKTFLYAVSRRIWLKQLTRGNSRYQMDDLSKVSDTLVAEDAIEEHEQLEAKFQHMDEALQNLGEPCKTILEDFYLQNKSMQDICDKFGYTNTDNVKTQKYKCLQRLKKIFFKS